MGITNLLSRRRLSGCFVPGSSGFIEGRQNEQYSMLQV